VRINLSAKFRRFASAVDSIDTTKLFLDSAQERKELALDLNRLQLQAESIGSEGQSLGTYVKKSKKQGARDLYDTGEFQGKMFLDTKQLPIFIGSKDSKAPILSKVYGPVLGLIKPNEEEFGNEVRKVYITKVNNHIDLLAKKILY